MVIPFMVLPTHHLPQLQVTYLMDFAVERTLAHVVGVEPTSLYSQRNRVFYPVLKLHMYGRDYVYALHALVPSF